MAKKDNVYLRANSGNPELVSRVANQNAGVASSCSLADSAIKKGGDMQREVSFILLRQPLSVVCHSN